MKTSFTNPMYSQYRKK